MSEIPVAGQRVARHPFPLPLFRRRAPHASSRGERRAGGRMLAAAGGLAVVARGLSVWNPSRWGRRHRREEGKEEREERERVLENMRQEAHSRPLPWPFEDGR